MKKITLYIALGLLSCFSFAQSSDDVVKKEVIKLLEQFEDGINVLGDPKSTSAEIKSARSRILNSFTDKGDFVLNDVDTSKKYPGLVTIEEYVDNYHSFAKLGLKSKYFLSKGVGSGVYVERGRNAYTYKMSYKLVHVFSVLKETKKDSISYDTLYVEADSSEIKSIDRIDSTVHSMVQIDTVSHKEMHYVNAFVEMILRDGKYQDYKLVATCSSKKKPQYRPLDELTAWWVSLDDQWQKLITDQLKFPKVPTPYWLKMVGGIKFLDLSNAQMKTYEPLYKFAGIEKLKLEDANIDTLIYLKNMSYLKAINLNGTKIKSLNGLNPKSLEFLFCRDLGLTDIDGLTGSTKLIVLDFSGNDVESLIPLRLNTQIEELYFNANEVIDLSPIARLTTLEKLHCGKNKEIKSLAPLRGMYNLVELDVFNTGIESLQDISGLTKITRLDISFTKINSLYPMRHLKYLTYLAFSGNHLDNYGVLDGFQYLKTLKCAQTNISDISPVNRMDGILVLYAPHTQFSKSDIQRFKKNHPKCQITYY